MESNPGRTQVGLVAVGYAVALCVAATLVFSRYMLYVNHRADATAAGGMYACGDLMLALMIAGLFCAPTFLLIWVIRKSESAYTLYAKVLLGLSVTLPVGLVSVFPAVSRLIDFGEVGLYRLFISPVMVIVLVISRLFAQFARSKRLIMYALGIEVGTLILGVVVFLIATRALQGLH
jgi:hypothetical protein